MEVLQDADRTLAHRFRKQPLIEATMRFQMGRIYSELERDDLGLLQFRRAAELRRRDLGADHRETLAAENELTHTLSMAGLKDDAIAMGRTVLAARRRVLGPNHPDTLFSQARLALALSRWSPESLDEALALAREAAEIASRLLGPDHETTWITLLAQGKVHARRAEFEPAVVLTGAAAVGHERVFGPLHSETLWARWSYARALEGAGRIADARAVLINVAERWAQSHGLAHGFTWFMLRGAISLLRSEGDFVGVRDLAEAWVRRLLEAQGEPDPFTPQSRSYFLGQLVRTLLELPEGVALDTALAVRAAEESADPVPLAQVYARLGQVDTARQRLAEAARRASGDAPALKAIAWLLANGPEPKLRDPARAVALARKATAARPGESTYWNTLGTALYRAGDWPEAIEALRKSNELEPGSSLGHNGYFLAMAHHRRGEASPARVWFDVAGRWHHLKAPADAELKQFRAEAAQLLGLGPEADREQEHAAADDATLARLVLQADPSAAWARAWLHESQSGRGSPADPSAKAVIQFDPNIPADPFAP
jgi:tetratricopeptide (TPR) repeat protein